MRCGAVRSIERCQLSVLFSFGHVFVFIYFSFAARKLGPLRTAPPEGGERASVRVAFAPSIGTGSRDWDRCRSPLTSRQKAFQAELPVWRLRVCWAAAWRSAGIQRSGVVRPQKSGSPCTCDDRCRTWRAQHRSRWRAAVDCRRHIRPWSLGCPRCSTVLRNVASPRPQFWDRSRDWVRRLCTQIYWPVTLRYLAWGWDPISGVILALGPNMW